MTRAALLAALLAAPAAAATLNGGDYAGGDLLPSNGDVLSGTFTNVRLFSLPAGTTVFVFPGVTLSVHASTISIAGAIDGGGRGQLGGSGGNNSAAGSGGFGGGPSSSGAGNAGIAARGGGGGAYGGAGGAGGGGAAGGSVYDSTGVYTAPISADDVFQGSGGGGGGGSSSSPGGSGSNGGAAVYLEAASMTITGAILLQGATAPTSIDGAGNNPGGGGGGSGGGLALRAPGALTINGARLSANGGRGGNVADTFAGTIYPGGGGGGGRVKIFSNTASFTSVTITTAAGSAGGNGGVGGVNGAPAPAAGAAGSVSFGTIASSPSAFAASSVYATSIAWTWSAAPSFGDAPAASQAYRIFPATAAAPLSSPEALAGALATSATVSSLTPNTTYFRFVTAYTDWGDSAPSNAASTHTLASAPAAAGFSSMGAASLTVSWTGGTPANPSYTTYEVQSALDAGFTTGVATGFVAALSSAASALSANTTYFFRARAVNLDGVPTAYTAVMSTSTLALAPANPAVGTVYVTSAAFSWTAGGNPGGTQYSAEVSSDNFFSLIATSATLQGSATFFGLTPGSQYFFRVRALNRNSVPSAYSASVSTRAGNLADTSPPSAPGTPSSNVQFSYDGNVLFSWTAASSSVGILDYELLLGSTPGGNDVFNGTVSVSCYTATGLATGRSYYAQVRARSNAGVVGPFSGVGVGVPVFVPAQTAAIPKPRVWPNPANPAQGPVQVGFFLEEPADVLFRVFTLQGRLISESTRRYATAGNQIGTWDGAGSGGRVAPGGYIMEIRKRYAGRTDSQKVKIAILY